MTTIILGTPGRTASQGPARAGRWWRKWGEAIALIVLSGCAVASLLAFLAGNPALGGLIALGGLLFIVYGYANWFNGLG